VVLRDREVAVGASIGVAVSPAEGEEFEALLHTADLDMYASKAGDAARR
jgi:predicted signal transduction protein with EAL and GGDEF domain